MYFAVVIFAEHHTEVQIEVRKYCVFWGTEAQLSCLPFLYNQDKMIHPYFKWVISIYFIEKTVTELLIWKPFGINKTL